ncbi:hypothetical protein E6B08_08150 [Pseudomonas putida]|uniref:Uncharacterized protein n=1 Tax=Pseudomonas putida TaxID=303 RepID=A0A4D6XB16_PSEPU|nr:hypothetical protein [Pseudomonas putida]QCI11370.1 hypothetical protein E6B08_08150 [Pseudomonas putida]
MNSKSLIQPQIAGTQSLEDFLENMRKGVQTFGWDALLVFDKAATNTLLMQEYIDRFDTDSYFPPFPNDVIDTEEGYQHVLIGLVMDKPRLSFENATIVDSRGKLVLRMVGGKQVQLHKSFKGGNEVRSIKRLSVLNAAAGPALLMNIKLSQVPGSVDTSGKVMLNLSEGTDHVFTGLETQYEKIKLGLHLESIIKKWGSELTQFQLSELAQDEGADLQPGEFGIRTHPAPGASVLGSGTYGEGAVVVFIAMRGSKNGSYPHADGDLLYMLPTATTPYTSNLLLGNRFILEEMILPRIERAQWVRDGKFVVRDLGGDAGFGLYPTAGSMAFGGLDTIWQNGLLETYTLKGPGGRLYFGEGDPPMQFRVVGNILKFSWVSLVTDVSYHWTWVNVPFGGDEGDIPYSLQIEAQADFRFYLKQEEGRNVIAFEMIRTSEVVNFDYAGGASVQAGHKEIVKKKADEYISALKGGLRLGEQLVTALAGIDFSLDAFRLNSLLFRSQNVVSPRDLNWPLDLTVLGDLAPERTTLVVSPAEVIVAAGKTTQFTIEPDSSDVAWAVENLPGETGAKGNIDDNGLYTAPSADSLREAGHRRVIVTAAREGMVSKALVSLVENEVSVYPLVAAVSLGANYPMSAGSPDSAALEWQDPPEELGTIAPDTDPDNPGGYVFTATTMLPPWQSGDPLHYFGLRLVPITVQPKVGGEPATIDMLVVGAQTGNYWLEPNSNADGSVTVKFKRLNRNGEVTDVPDDDTEWTLLKGDGAFENGVYTPKEGSAEQYAIIVAFYDDGDSADRFDYIILPVPFVSVKRYADMLNPAIKEV